MTHVTVADAKFAAGEDRRRRREGDRLKLRPATAEAVVSLPIEAAGLTAAVEEAMGRLLTQDSQGRSWADYLLPERHGDETVLEIVVRVRHSS